MCESFNNENGDCFIEPVTTAINDVYRSVQIVPSMPCLTSDQLLLCTSQAIRQVLDHCLAKGENIKAYTATKVLMHKINILDGTVDKEENIYFTNKAASIQVKEDIADFLINVGKKLDQGIEKYTSKGSNWIVSNIENIKLHFIKYRLLWGGANKFLCQPNSLKNSVS